MYRSLDCYYNGEDEVASWSIWGYMGLYGAIWGYLGLYGSIWVYMGLYGAIWSGWLSGVVWLEKLGLRVEGWVEGRVQGLV